MSEVPLRVLVDGRDADGDGDGKGAGWPLDRGLHYGDGLFETMRVRQGAVRFAGLHRQRLGDGLHRLGITLNEAQMWQQVQEAAATHGNAMLKLIVTRGDATARGYSPSGAEQPRRLLLIYADAASPVPASSVERTAVTLHARLGENPILAGLKHLNRLEQVLARIELAATGAFEGLIGSSSGLLISGTIGNVYIRRYGNWLTPRIDRCGIKGVMRTAALREAMACGLAIEEADIPLAALRDCQSVYLSNARLGLMPLTQLDGRPLMRDAAMDRLARHLETLDD